MSVRVRGWKVHVMAGFNYNLDIGKPRGNLSTKENVWFQQDRSITAMSTNTGVEGK